jgi:hypothetical protein
VPTAAVSAAEFANAFYQEKIEKTKNQVERT